MAVPQGSRGALQPRNSLFSFSETGEHEEPLPCEVAGLPVLDDREFGTAEKRPETLSTGATSLVLAFGKRRTECPFSVDFMTVSFERLPIRLACSSGVVV